MLSDEREWLRSQRSSLALEASSQIPDGTWVWMRQRDPIGRVDREQRIFWAFSGLGALRPPKCTGIKLSIHDYLMISTDEAIRGSPHIRFR